MGKTASISFDPNEFERAEEVCRLEKTIVGRNYLAVVDLEEHRSAYRPYELGYRRLTVVVVDGHLVEAKEVSHVVAEETCKLSCESCFQPNPIGAFFLPNGNRYVRYWVRRVKAYSRLKAALLVDKGTLRYSSSLRTIGPA